MTNQSNVLEGLGEPTVDYRAEDYIEKIHVLHSLIEMGTAVHFIGRVNSVYTDCQSTINDPRIVLFLRPIIDN